MTRFAAPCCILEQTRVAEQGRRCAVNSNPVLRINESGTNGDFWDTVRHTGHSCPEQDLFLAVLKDALLHYRKNLGRTNKAFRAERAWFFDNKTDRLFSFESVCAALGLNAALVVTTLTSVRAMPLCRSVARRDRGAGERSSARQ